MKIIDPHLHLFDLSQGDYGWLKPENPPFWPDKKIIHHNFNEQSLRLDSPIELAGFVHIEAGFDNQHPWRELQWLEQHCQLPFKAVACADISLAPDKFARQLAQLQQQTSLMGIRHILDEQALSILSLPQVIENFTLLANSQLSFDCQLSLTDDAAITKLCQILPAIPELLCIINHGGFPPLASEQARFQQWQNNIQRLAANPKTLIKCSGWEMVDRHYSCQFVQHVIATCLEYFGDARVMLASNFPLTLLSQPYHRYWHTMVNLLDVSTRQQLCYQNAQRCYRLDLSSK